MGAVVKVYNKDISAYGINVCNNENINKHFNNPFGSINSPSGYIIPIKGNTEEAANLYKAWLQNDIELLKEKLNEDELLNLSREEERRKWIVKEVKSGKLENAILLYPDNSINNFAHVLKDMINGDIPIEIPGKQLVGREFRFAVHVPKNEKREDAHIVKELLHFKDGTTKPNLRIIKNFKRPFYITKDHYKNHEQKKEFEDVNKLNKFFSTQSELANNIALKLGKTGYNRNNMRDVRDSPFLYAADIDSTVFLNHLYKTTYPDLTTPLSVAGLDVETDIDTGEMTAITVVLGREVFTVATKKLVRTNRDITEIIKRLFRENVPVKELADECSIETIVAETPMEAIQLAFNKLHKWKPDTLAIWNMLFDIGVIVRTCNEYNVRPEDIFSDPSIPENLRMFKIKEGSRQKVMESGKMTPISVEKQWHTVISTSSFYVIDPMTTYNFVRNGGHNVPGGYGLDNILKVELNFGKLKFEDVDLVQAEWHKYMSKHKPLEYIVYNQWDTLGMILLDEKTKDIKTNLPVLSIYSGWEKFNSGPKKIIDAFFFDALEKGFVLGTKSSKINADHTLGLDGWIVTLEAFRVVDNGLNILEGEKNSHTNAQGHVYDSDITSAYPSCGAATNLSMETTKRELISIEGVSKDKFKRNNINLMFGSVNAIDYCAEMLKFPTLEELNKIYKDTLQSA